jgi:anaerobic dimethyl sulfoxide reductase subunit C (anchor subunit)
MNVHELPLVVFTIFGQMSVGCFVVLGVLHLLGRRVAGPSAVDRLSDPALYAIGPVMVLGLVASIFHLGNPVNALHTVSNLGSSWLSREILLGCAFAGLGAAFAVCQQRKWLTAALRQTLAAVTAVVGLGLVFVMSQVYMLPTVPAWDTWATPVSFFTTTFLLGSLAIGSALVVTATVQRRRETLGDDADRLLRGTVRGISVSSIVLLGVEVIVLPNYVLHLATAQSGLTAEHALLVGGGAVFAARLVLVFLGAGLLSLVLYRLASTKRDSLLVAAASTAFGLVFVSEIIGRILFYGSFDRIGM